MIIKLFKVTIQFTIFMVLLELGSKMLIKHTILGKLVAGTIKNIIRLMIMTLKAVNKLLRLATVKFKGVIEYLVIQEDELNTVEVIRDNDTQKDTVDKLEGNDAIKDDSVVGIDSYLRVQEK